MSLKRQQKSADTDNFFANIPQDLRDAVNWVCWQFKKVDGKIKKVPTDQAGKAIDFTNPEKFLAFNDALAAFRNNSNLDGIGFAMTPKDGLCCIDLDHCFDEGGRLLTQAWMILKDIGPTYVERSPSGQGLHIWTKASVIDGRRFKTPDGAEVEIYGEGRYMTITGNRYECAGYPHHPHIEEKQAHVEALIARMDAAKATPTTASTVGGKGSRDAWKSVVLDYGPLTDEDRSILDNLSRHWKWREIEPLWHGNLSEYIGPDGKPDESKADMALAAKLAWWAMFESARLCRMFTASALGRRPKWRREDYARRTIWRALQNSASAPPPGEPPPYLADTAKAAEETQARRGERLADAILQGRQAATDRTEEPPPIKYIINPQLSEDTGVALLVGPGGSGKSFQALIRCIAIASGRPIGKAHRTEVTAPACFFSLEDPPNVLKRRYYHTIAAIEETFGAFTTGQLAALDANLYRFPVRGQMGALMELDGKGNPRPTEHYHALRNIIERIRPAYIVLDTMSRALGIDENSNAHAAQWITALEEILFDHPGTVFQIVGHTGKGNQDGKDEDPLSIRGASAFAWNARAEETYVKAGARELKLLGLDGEDGDVFKLTAVKYNYTARLEPVYFRRNEHGVPIEIDTETMKLAEARANYEAAILAVPELARAWEAKGGPLNRRNWERRSGEDLTDPAKPKPGREQLAHDALTRKGISFDQVAQVIAEAISRGYVEAVEIKEEGRKGRAPVCIKFLTLPPAELADTE